MLIGVNWGGTKIEAMAVDDVGRSITRLRDMTPRSDNVADDLRRTLKREVRIANDADCFAVSEAVDGAGAAETRCHRNSGASVLLRCGS
jgi:fructokinase